MWVHELQGFLTPAAAGTKLRWLRLGRCGSRKAFDASAPVPGQVQLENGKHTSHEHLPEIKRGQKRKN